MLQQQISLPGYNHTHTHIQITEIEFKLNFLLIKYHRTLQIHLILFIDQQQRNLVFHFFSNDNNTLIQKRQPKTMAMEHKKLIITLSIIGLILTIIGIVFLPIGQNLISNILHKKLATLPDNPGYILWRDMDIPIYQKFYLFNITNTEEMLSGGRPTVNEIGPFVYHLNMTKGDIKFNSNNTIVSYVEKKQFHFDANLSSYDLQTQITIMNIPLITVYKMLDSNSIPPILKPIIRAIFNRLKFSFFITASVDELLFSGYKSELLCELKRILPKQVPSCYFSLMSNQNDTWSGPYVQYTGHDQIDRLTTLISFNGSSKLNYWRTDKCNQINGTQNGELFPPAGQFGQRKIYQFFRPDFCRTFNLTLNETNIQSDVGSLRTDRFHIDRHSFMNSIDYPPNSCYQSKLSSIKMAATSNASTAATAMDNDEKQRWKRTIDQLLKTFKLDSKEINQNSTEWINDNTATMIMKQPVIKPSGVFDISSCQQGAPIFISLPHFLDASDYYRKQLNGLHPNRTKHESYIDIEPQTGTPVDFIARIQVNVDLQTAGTSQPKMASLIMPTMWQSLAIHITPEIANTIEQQTKQPRIIAYTVAALILIIGSIMLIYSIFVCVLYYWHRHHLDDDYNEFINDNDQTSDPLITNNNNNNEQRQQQPQSNEIMTSTDHDDNTTATNSNYGTVS